MWQGVLHTMQQGEDQRYFYLCWPLIAGQVFGSGSGYLFSKFLVVYHRLQSNSASTFVRSIATKRSLPKSLDDICSSTWNLLPYFVVFLWSRLRKTNSLVSDDASAYSISLPRFCYEWCEGRLHQTQILVQEYGEIWRSQHFISLHSLLPAVLHCGSLRDNELDFLMQAKNICWSGAELCGLRWNPYDWWWNYGFNRTLFPKYNGGTRGPIKAHIVEINQRLFGWFLTRRK